MPGATSAFPSTTVGVATGALGAVSNEGVGALSCTCSVARAALGASALGASALAGASFLGSSALGAAVLGVALGAGAATAWLMPLINTSF